ncbi:Syntaxin-12 [Trichinella britovi]|uniref:ubiquitinyl hydrolase 1 n=1 Tax=Trichinella britovi TaxID=45882 RepID=A0A0V1CPW6_TRIBR|nr:Syntaxin-12 [Trichinella britovi]
MPEITHIYHEKQYLQRCALHALNNLFQAEIFTKKQLDDICLRLSPSYLLNPHRSAFGLGNYDINVIETALQGVGCVALWFDKRKDVRSIDLANIVGLIINVPVNSKIFNFSLPFATRRHWFSIRKINGKFYNLDSKLTSAQCIGSDEEMLQYIFQILTNKGVQMFIIVRKEIVNGSPTLLCTSCTYSVLFFNESVIRCVVILENVESIDHGIIKLRFQHSSDERGKDFNRLSQLVSTQISKISQNVATIQRMVAQLGTTQDSEHLRQNLHEIQHFTHTLSQTTMESLKNLSSLPSPSNASEQLFAMQLANIFEKEKLTIDVNIQFLKISPRQWKLQRERLTNDFSVVLNNFQAVQRSAAQKEKVSVLRARVDSGIGGNPFNENASELNANVVPQEKLQIEQNLDIQTIQEREQVIRQLESDIMDVNQIFKDLALMVHQQGEVIDSIEANVDNAQVHIDQGSTQIQRAAQYQSKARRKKMLCCSVIIVLIIVISLIIYFTTGGK